MSNETRPIAKTTTDHLSSALWHISIAQDAAANDFAYEYYQPFREELQERHNEILALLRFLQHSTHKQKKA